MSLCHIGENFFVEEVETVDVAILKNREYLAYIQRVRCAKFY